MQCREPGREEEFSSSVGQESRKMLSRAKVEPHRGVSLFMSTLFHRVVISTARVSLRPTPSLSHQETHPLYLHRCVQPQMSDVTRLRRSHDAQMSVQLLVGS